ncbi:26S proteasome, regulatory subunit Rpn7 domain-containing protein [Rozella allomycis CSF55]|uniref:26S proteasome, regulatory subunit Rpn7 domain-containing protein n=1 Tax=Rozella allomycis (strain CSF55) TaxID=988480 RepID=A0A075B4W0_ROZAC|nr:26S proteasome, regulatory subunit Rpn7 domain-containing protein [Rozella allomycis CSF55]|eukprot:EPZ36681.1 26S proteasome, regulatory subunit Rpn7 domain-containing protein [Rozella allomycis CSF55]
MELRHYRSSMIKESIRIGQMQVAEVFHKYGQYEEALKSYSAVREVCTTSHHVYDLTLKLLDVYLNLSNFSGIPILISRAKSSASRLSEQELGIFDIYLALSYFGLGDFKNAANVLLSLKLSTFETNGNSMLPLIPCDVAILGTLSALASFSREDVFQRTIQNSEFQKFLETQNEMKDLIEMYKYAKLNAFFDFLNGKLYLAKSFMSEKNELLERLVYLINEHNLPIMIDEKEMKVLFDEKASKKKVDIVCNEMDSKLTSLEQFYKSNQIKNI